MKIRKKLYKTDPDRWVEDYTTSLNSLSNSYYNQHRLDEAILLHEDSVKILKELYKKNPDRWADSYSLNLNNLAYSYEEQNRLDEALTLKEEALEIRRKLYKENPLKWLDVYISSLNDLASSLARKRDFKKASELFETYFHVSDFENQDEVIEFIYPFVKWYQCEVRLENYLQVAKLEKKASELIKLYQDKLGIECEDVVEEVHDGYLSLKDSEDDFDREKYDIFVKIFINRG